MDSLTFVLEVKRLQLGNGLTDAQVCSALVGIVISLCIQNNEDPIAYMKWAVELINKKG